MPYEQTDVEIEISGILDRLGSEMQAAAKRLRFAPYTNIEDFLAQSRQALRQVNLAGASMKRGNFNTALAMLRCIEVPEIDFTDEDEEEPRF
ncbi:MAG TPA: hypothetical protein VJ464_16000 [Blastocatellia bacterium]|nr:hypothetical protein [Blastocatellia bacterium]